MQLRESAENYLKTIFLLTKKAGAIRSVDIAEEMGFSKPSVSVAMKKLRENELIHIDSNGYILLTEQGEQIAEHVYERYSTLYEWLVSLGTGKRTAEAEACRIEHVLTDDIIEVIKQMPEACATCQCRGQAR